MEKITNLRATITPNPTVCYPEPSGETEPTQRGYAKRGAAAGREERSGAEHAHSPHGHQFMRWRQEALCAPA